MIDAAVHNTIADAARIFYIDDFCVIFPAARSDEAPDLQHRFALIRDICQVLFEIAEDKGVILRSIFPKVANPQARPVFDLFNGNAVAFRLRQKRGQQLYFLCYFIFAFLCTAVKLYPLNFNG